MSEPSIDVMRSRACQRAFLAMMWGFLFLLPLGAVKVQASVFVYFLPDAAGWLIIVVALGMLRDLHPSVRALRRLAVVGLVVCAPRVLTFHEMEAPWQHVYRFLQMGGAMVALVFAWRLCGLVADVAGRAESPSLRQNAKLRFWLYAAGVLLPFTGPLIKDVSRALFDGQRAFFEVGVVAVMFVYIAITISLMMELMAGTARMCARLEREHQEAVQKGEADT